MAELRAAEAAVAALETALATLRPYYEAPTLEEADETVRAALAALQTALSGDVDTTMTKFRDRVKMVDPVTNAPRFGPKTMARVVDMLQKYDAIYDEAIGSEMLKTLQHRVDMVEVKRAQDARAKQQQEAEARDAERQQQERERQRAEAEQQAKREQERAAEAQRVAELARLAQQKREERERQRRIDEARALEEQEQLARQNTSVVVGVDGLLEAVATLRQARGPDARQTLHKLHELIAAICASPENAAFRHIPKDNANFHNDIGQYDGGHACLLAMGFKELETEPGKRVFILEEPDLSDDFDKWSQWFDGLKEMKAWLEAEASK